ncbi:hypothetical protein [Halosolutus halophilus]|uniref:hypothetical protein n=1 Tax=Halosolutus halophilus TaxID=1552990 RepID=UPI00223522B8|nr:hypothetical protein [Halosolutus halophilus]
MAPGVDPADPRFPPVGSPDGPWVIDRHPPGAVPRTGAGAETRTGDGEVIEP